MDMLIADLQRQRRQLESDLDDTDRSHRTTEEILDKIVELKERAAKLAAMKPPSEPAR